MSHVYFQLLQGLVSGRQLHRWLSVFRKIICKFLHPHDSESSPVLYLSDIKIQLIPVPHFTEQPLDITKFDCCKKKTGEQQGILFLHFVREIFRVTSYLSNPCLIEQLRYFYLDIPFSRFTITIAQSDRCSHQGMCQLKLFQLDVTFVAYHTMQSEDSFSLYQCARTQLSI